MRKKLNTKLNMAKWIVALRSGRYKQTTGALCNEIGYCCLGVACKISRLGKWEDTPNASAMSPGQQTFITTDGKSTGVLPQPVQEWLGVSDANPYIDGASATAKNDIACCDFAQIAQGLEDTYLAGKSAEKIVARAKAAAAKRKAVK